MGVRGGFSGGVRSSVAFAVVVAAAVGALATESVGAAPAPRQVPRFETDAPFAPDSVLVRFDPRASGAQVAAVLDGVAGRNASPASPLAPDVMVVDLPPGSDVEDVISDLMADPAVDVVEPDYLVFPTAESNDPAYTSGALWGMNGDSLPSPHPSNSFGSQAAEAWSDGFTGSSSVAIGIIDEGVQVAHPDLVDNIWVNPYDPVNGLDDDGNGYVDDVNGWDFVSNDNTVYDSTADDHGTHVAGTIGGTGNNGIGVAGVNWDVTMIVAKFLGASGGRTSDAIRALDYIVDLQRRHPSLNIIATSNSWSGAAASQLLQDAIDRSGDAGMLFIAAAGNDGANLDTAPRYPAAYECTNGGRRGWDCIVTVGAHDSAGAIASFSNYSATQVDISAPGVAVRSTIPASTYSDFNGTSMATPHVSGAVALCRAKSPAMTAPLIRQALLASSVPTTSWAGKNVTEGRLDIDAMLAACPSAAAPTGTPGSLVATANGANRVDLTWTDPVNGETAFEVQRAVRVGTVCGTFTTRVTTFDGVTTWSDRSAPAGTSLCYRVRAVNTRAGGSSTAYSAVAVVTTAAGLASMTCPPATFGWHDIATSGTALTFTSSDEGTASVTLPFTFRFAGTNRTTANVSPNGFISFGAIPGDTWKVQPLPSPAGPNAVIAPYWTDLQLGTTGTVRTQTFGTTPNRTFVISWLNLNGWSAPSSRFTFQLLLREKGTFGFRYAKIDGLNGYAPIDSGGGVSASIGAEDDAGLSGVRAAIPRAGLANGTAFECVDMTVPGAVRSMKGAPGNGRVSVSWSAPASNGGSAITDYVVTAAPGGATCTTTRSTSCTVSGLRNGTRYTFSIRAANGVGAGTAATVKATPRTVPGVPRSVSAKAGNKKVTVSWKAPTSNGGAPITGYTVRATPGGRTCTTTGALSCTVTGLSAGTRYRFTVTARNAAGAGRASTASSPVAAR